MKEVVRAVAVRPLPKARPMVEGVFCYRGQLVPLLDIGQRLRIERRPLQPSQKFIIVHSATRLLAIRVDDVEGLVEVPEAEIDDVRRCVPEAELVAGVVKRPDGLILIHDLETFLSAEEVDEIDQALADTDPADAECRSP